MNERIKEFAKKTLSKDQFGLWLAGDDDIEKFAELVEQDCIDKFMKVWYEQGMDIRGAELDKFMKRFKELSNDSVPS